MLDDMKLLIHDIIFVSCEERYEIDFNMYESLSISNIDKITDYLTMNLIKCGLDIIEESILLTKDTRKLILKIKR